MELLYNLFLIVLRNHAIIISFSSTRLYLFWRPDPCLLYILSPYIYNSFFKVAIQIFVECRAHMTQFCKIKNKNIFPLGRCHPASGQLIVSSWNGHVPWSIYLFCILFEINPINSGIRRGNLTTCPLEESNILCHRFLNLNSSSELSCKWRKSYGVKGLIF